MSGSLTTAVIDTLHGAPAVGMLVDLFRLPRGVGERHHLKTIETDEKGAVATVLIEGDDFVAATYELLYHVGRYFKAQRVVLDDAPFLDVIPIRFSIADPNRTYHLALLTGPWSYMMYRA
jgi:5-hydroxyisourate hydrolase